MLVWETETAVKLYRLVKAVPSVLTAKTPPLPEPPPNVAVPYRTLPDRINPARGLAPSLLVAGEPEVAGKLCKFVKPEPSVLTRNTVPLPELPPPFAVP